MKVRLVLLLCVLMAAIPVAVACRRAAEAPTSTPVPTGSFVPVRELLTQRCALASCHSRETRSGKLDLTAERSRGNMVGITSAQSPDRKLVIAGDAGHSYLLAKLRGERGIKGGQMPLGNTPLTPEDLSLIEDWIAAGAEE